METTKAHVDIVEEIPDPDTLRVQIKESLQRTELLRGLLKLSLKKATRYRTGREEVPRASGQ
jgi:hypothetical protein